jgi:hypothetical protein
VLKRRDFKHSQVEIDKSAENHLRQCIHYINLYHPELEKNLLDQFRHPYLNLTPKAKMRVMYDWAPLSFSFEMMWYDEKYNEFRRDYNGGIIFHGAHDGGGDGGAPTFSINLTPMNGWATHT